MSRKGTKAKIIAGGRQKIQELSENYSQYNNILILDNASYHISQGTEKFPVPENVKLLYLPTYSPDFNPIERLWKYFKDEFINNRFFENVADCSGRIQKKPMHII